MDINSLTPLLLKIQSEATRQKDETEQARSNQTIALTSDMGSFDGADGTVKASVEVASGIAQWHRDSGLRVHEIERLGLTIKSLEDVVSACDAAMDCNSCCESFETFFCALAKAGDGYTSRKSVLEAHRVWMEILYSTMSHNKEEVAQ